jgi:hypothetical protein
LLEDGPCGIVAAGVIKSEVHAGGLLHEGGGLIDGG